MRPSSLVGWLMLGQSLVGGVVASAQATAATSPEPAVATATAEATTPSTPPVGSLLRSLEPPALRELAAEVLERNPEIARARHLAVAAALRAPQVRALPDPVAAVSLFVLPPETRVGPQRLSASIQQRLPWFGKLDLASQAALYQAAAAEAEVEMRRLDKLTEVRRLLHELAFLDAHRDILTAERSTLARYETTAQGRYAAGTGLQQEIVRLQAQITRTDTQLLDIAERRFSLQAACNALRDRPADTEIDVPPLAVLSAVNQWPMAGFDGQELRRAATARRPELAATAARLEAARTLGDLADKGFRPDLTLGLSYTLVTGRDDAAGRANPPPDDGDDVLALNGSLNLPLRRRKLEAAVQEAQSRRWAAEEDQRHQAASIEAEIGDLLARIPLLRQHLRLLDGVLSKQAREALRSAETAYRIGTLNAMDLLDAEVVLFEVQLAAERTRTDLAVAWARLERAVAGPLDRLSPDPLSGPSGPDISSSDEEASDDF